MTKDNSRIIFSILLMAALEGASGVFNYQDRGGQETKKECCNHCFYFTLPTCVRNVKLNYLRDVT